MMTWLNPAAPSHEQLMIVATSQLTGGKRPVVTTTKRDNNAGETMGGRNGRPDPLIILLSW